MNLEPVWITATPPTPNGALHIGHMAGPYIAADVLRRYLSAEGADVRLTTGLDDHQSYVPVMGLREHRAADEVADDYGAMIIQAWSDAGIRFDRIVRPRADLGYTEFVQEFFGRLVTDGAIVPRTRPLPWCDGCERWLYEAYLGGGCPHCGAATNGNACEACGRPNDCGDVIDPRCTTCGSPATLRDCKRLYFRLDAYADDLVRLWRTATMPPHLLALCETMLADGLPDIAVSHPAEWGIPVPVNGFEDQRVYVWFEMAPGYLREYPVAGVRPAPIQFFGFDNGYFHAILFPALFRAYDSTIALPTTFVVNEFYRLTGAKFSTSRRHAVWAHDALAEVGADLVRYHVLTDRPTGRQTNFDPADLDRSGRRLDDRWNAWLRRLLDDLATHCGGRAPAEAPAGPDWDRLRRRLARTVEDLRDAYAPAGFDPRRAIALLDEVVAMAVDYGHVHDHERARPDGAPAYRSALAAQLAVAAGLAALAAPMLPGGAARLARCLGVEPDRRVDIAAFRPLPPGQVVAVVPGPIFGICASSRVMVDTTQ